MFQLIYASTAASRFTDGQLFDMLACFRANNVRAGVTGLLLYKLGSFVQLLEGEEAPIRRLYATICADERHHQVDTLLEINVEQRQFPAWSMGFQHLGTASASAVDGYKTPAGLAAWFDILPWKASVAMQLLATFNEQV